MDQDFREGQTVNSMVTKQAVPPMKLEIGSARKTPVVPRPAISGRSKVSGITIITFLSREKKMAFRQSSSTALAILR